MTILICIVLLLFCGSVIGEPCELPTGADYVNAARELNEHPQGIWEIMDNSSVLAARAKVAQYEACMKQQEANVRRERIKAETELLRAETRRAKTFATNIARQMLCLDIEALSSLYRMDKYQVFRIITKARALKLEVK